MASLQEFPFVPYMSIHMLAHTNFLVPLPFKWTTPWVTPVDISVDKCHTFLSVSVTHSSIPLPLILAVWQT